MRRGAFEVRTGFLFRGRECVSKGDPFMALLGFQIPQFFFKDQSFPSVFLSAGGCDGFSPGEQVNIFHKIIHIFPKTFFFVIPVSSGDFPGQDFLAGLAAKMFQLLVIVLIQPFEFGLEGGLFTRMLGQQFAFVRCQFHVPPMLRIEGR